MFLPDMRTIYFITMLINLVLATLMLVYWRTQKTYAGFSYMVLSTSLIALTFLLFTIRGWIPDYISILGANLLVGLAMLFRLEGFRRFVGFEQFRRCNLIPVAGMLLTASYFTFVQNSEMIRAIILSVVVIYFIIKMLYTLLTSTNQAEKPLISVIVVIHTIYVLVMSGRALAWLFIGPEMHLFAPTMSNVGFFIYSLMNNVALTIVYIMMNGQRLTNHLTVAQQALELLATKDSLTDLYNHRTLRELGQSELLRSRRMNHELALLMFDIDRFKHVNDTYGHAAGDKVLNLLGNQALRTCRSMDIVARMGGDEFVMLLPETSAENAVIVAGRLQRIVAQEACEWDGQQIKITLSIGLTALTPDDREFESLLRRADDALYEAKRTGRDRLIVL